MSQQHTFHQIALDNGLTIVGERNPQARTFAAGYFVRTGSRDETAPVSGVSHFLEHMMFKGSDRRSAEDINREFDELGANYNAFTSEERTVYYGAVLASFQDRLLDLLTDMMRPALRESDFDMEKNVILEEIAMYQDHPQFRVFDLAAPRFFRGHPLGNSVLGSVESIKGLSRDAMMDYFVRRYAADNLTLVVAGNFDWDALVAQVTGLSRSWSSSGAGREHPALEPAGGMEFVTDSKLNRVHLAFHAPGVSAQSELRRAASLLASCLGDASGSRLFWALVDRGIADSASFSLDAGDGSGTFAGYASTEPDRAEQVRDVFLEVVRGIQDELPSAAEWRAAQTKAATGLTLGGETPFGRLISLGSAWSYRREYRTVREEVEAIMNTSLDDAAGFLADRPFDRLFTLQLGPDAGQS